MEIIAARRKDDLVIVIAQHNEREIITIEDLNNAASETLCYSKKELIGKHLYKIVDDNTKRRIDLHIEYEKYGIDIGAILMRVRNIYLKTKHEEQIKVKIKIFPVTSVDGNRFRFEILARTMDYQDELGAFRECIEDHEHSIDERFQVIDNYSTRREFGILSEFTKKYNVSCIACIAELNCICFSSVMNIAEIFKSNTRMYDEIGIIGENIIAFLIGCSEDDAYTVLTRIHCKIKSLGIAAKLHFFDLKKYPITKPEDELLVQTDKFPHHIL